MASHITCHSNDILPNTFPPPRPTPKDHGFVSRYEQTHFMRNVGLSSFEDVDDEFDVGIPAQYKPLPTQSASCVKMSTDPALCLTPESKTSRKQKSKKEYLYSSENTNNNALLRDSKGKSLKVQFDPVVDVKHMSPEQNASETDISIIDVGTVDVSTVDTEETEKHMSELSFSGSLNPVLTRVDQPSSLSSSRSVYKTVLPIVKPSLGSNSSTATMPVPFTQNSQLEHSSQFASNVVQPNISAQSSLISERISPTKGLETIEVPFTSQIEHVLARPEFNSTAVKMKELQKLKESPVDVTGTVTELLKKYTVKSKIEEKAFNKVNIKAATFTDLPSVEVKEADLVKKAEKKESSRAKPFKRQKPASEVIGSAPDVMEFFHPGLLKETASYTVPGLSKPQIMPQTAPRDTAFDLYRHQRAWEQLD